MLDVARPGPDYTLRWPREVFNEEGRALMAAPPVLIKKQWMDEVELLLEEAFITAMPVTDFRQSDQRSTWTELGRQHWSYAFWVGLQQGQLVRRSRQAGLSRADLALDNLHGAIDHDRSGVSGDQCDRSRPLRCER